MNIEISRDPVAEPIIAKILDEVRKSKTFLVTTHVGCDGDGVGSGLALISMLRKMGKRAHMVADHGIGREFRFLPGSDDVGSGPKDLWQKYDWAFVVDSGSFERLERVGRALPQGMRIVNIDHHLSNGLYGSINWVDPRIGATGEMVYRLIRASGIRMDRDIALCLYISLVTDTGRFSFTSTSSNSHLIAADLLSFGLDPGDVTRRLYRSKSLGELRLQAEVIRKVHFAGGRRLAWASLTLHQFRRFKTVVTDSQEYVDLLKSIDGVEVAILFREMGGDDKVKVKVSIRTDGLVDGSAVMKHFGGGGHRRAAGCMLDGHLTQAASAVVREACRALQEALQAEVRGMPERTPASY